MIRGDARQLPALLPPGTAGRAALVVTSPPYGPSVHGQVRAEQRSGGGGVEKYDNRYSHDPANLAHPGLDEMLAGFTQILEGCRVLLRPGGLAVVTARPWRHHGELVDLPAAVLASRFTTSPPYFDDFDDPVSPDAPPRPTSVPEPPQRASLWPMPSSRMPARRR